MACQAQTPRSTSTYHQARPIWTEELKIPLGRNIFPSFSGYDLQFNWISMFFKYFYTLIDTELTNIHFYLTVFKYVDMHILPNIEQYVRFICIFIYPIIMDKFRSSNIEHKCIYLYFYVIRYQLFIIQQYSYMSTYYTHYTVYCYIYIEIYIDIYQSVHICQINLNIYVS